MTIRKITTTATQIYTEMAKVFYSSPAVLENIPEENITSSFELFLAGTPWPKMTPEQELEEIYSDPVKYHALITPGDPQHKIVNRRVNELLGI